MNGENKTVVNSDETTQLFENELLDPVTQEIIDLNSLDEMVDAYRRLKPQMEKIQNSMYILRKSIGAMTQGETKTRRVRSDRYKVKVELPSTTFEQSMLKEAWNPYPIYREDYLKIDTIGVKRRELDKMRGTTGSDAFGSFRKMVLDAERESWQAPTVTIEEDMTRDAMEDI